MVIDVFFSSFLQECKFAVSLLRIEAISMLRFDFDRPLLACHYPVLELS